MKTRMFVKVLHAWLAAMCAALAGSAIAQAQGYPVKPIRLVVPLTPGGGNDTLARYVGKYLNESLGQSVIIENRTGGGEYAALLTSHPSLPVKTVRELIAFAKARPGQINFASAGNGSAGHLFRRAGAGNVSLRR